MVSGILRSRLLHSIGVSRASHLTPKARKLYDVATKLKRINRRLNYQNTSNKDNINQALAYAESNEFIKSKCTNRSYNFILCQLKMLQKSAKGRRLTFEDKVYALSLLKQGPKAYKILRATFALPSRKTLMSLLNKIHFTTGINKKVMDTLKTSIENLDFLDRYCVLMFDEISIDPSLTYDKKWDSIVGFKDVNGSKSLKFADHALVFMLQGLHKKWKQPISYHFSEGGLNSNELCVLIKNTILALQQTGFMVVCTVCDQYSANIKVIKKLKEASKKSCSSDIDIFEIGGQEIVAIYDPPHLLKGIRNNLLIHDVKFCIDGICKIASWKHIIQLYELDEGDFTTKMCYNLTDSHIYHDKLKKMKVKNAAQVFSHRVSTTMGWTVKYGNNPIIQIYVMQYNATFFVIFRSRRSLA